MIVVVITKPFYAVKWTNKGMTTGISRSRQNGKRETYTSPLMQS